MMAGKEVWGNIQSSTLKKHIKYCNQNICECISLFFDKLNGGRSGLAARFERMMAPNAVRSGIETHAEQISGRQRALEEAQKLYDDNGCGEPGAPAHTQISQEALENAARPIPTAEDWEAAHGRPMPEGNYTPGQNNNMQSLPYTGAFENDQVGNHSISDWEYWEEVTGLTGAALVTYLIISEGSRIFPPRNLVPVP